MATQYKVLVLPRDQIAEIEKTRRVAYPLIFKFSDNYKMTIAFDDGGCCLTLYNNQGNEVRTDYVLTKNINDVFGMSHGTVDYVAEICRGAASELTLEAAFKYVELSGKHCPFCGDTELHAKRMVTATNGAYRPVECATCEARWVEEYSLNTIVMGRGEHSWWPPKRNVLEKVVEHGT